ncbi:hypothetical protein OUZ56_021592 [Daphnia magna]|uniref:Uncharacterized protein n=1 Tax=Daphnia magna TaxID=35525 RepID=A0ABR0ATY2_9CRUS|nr:hypothetical protein OUZ56_021592 [Daphnia magna]
MASSGTTDKPRPTSRASDKRTPRTVSDKWTPVQVTNGDSRFSKKCSQANDEWFAFSSTS